MTVAGEGRAPGSDHILRLAQERDVSRAEASAIMDEVRTALDRWPDAARQAGVKGGPPWNAGEPGS
jgi:serine/threonine-protein kinase HipA